jgi:hypothetical protein
MHIILNLNAIVKEKNRDYAIRFNKDVKAREIQTKTQSHVGWNTRTLWNAHHRGTETQWHGGRGKGEGGRGNTKALGNAHSTQWHRGMGARREELNITLKKFNRIARIGQDKQDGPSVTKTQGHVRFKQRRKGT